MNALINGKAIKIIPDISKHSSDKNTFMGAQASEKKCFSLNNVFTRLTAKNFVFERV